MKRNAMPPRSARLPRSGIKASGKPIRKRNAKRHSAEWLRAYGSVARVEWVKSLPCVVTGECGDVENVHVRGGGGSRKADYIWIVPMGGCLHRVHLHQHGIRSFEKKYGIDLEAAAVATEIAWRAVAPPDYLHTTDPLCATCGASFREDGDQCASCAYEPPPRDAA